MTTEAIGKRPVASRWRGISVSRLARAVASRWRRSLQLRVVASSLGVSLAVVALVGMFLLDRVTSGLLESQRRGAEGIVQSAISTAETRLSTFSEQTTRDAQSVALQETAADVRKLGAPNTYSVVLVPSGPSSRAFLSPASTSVDDVPTRLRGMVARENTMAYVYSSIAVGDRREPAIVVGGPVTSPIGNYELYLVFPLTNEAETVSLVQRSLVGAGTGLALLIAGVVWFVTRQVVTPVQVAARVAARFAAGEFSERMTVEGEDELAQLAQTFNRMAGNLQQKIGELEELSRVQRRFVADVSHELRTPLTTVRMAADLLHSAREDFRPEISRSAELLQKELDRFEGLLVDLLEISRYDAGAAVLEPELVDLRVAVQRAVDAVAPLAARRGTDIIVRAVGTGDLLVEADPRRLQRILRNLVVNAVDHGEGLPVQVTLAGDTDAVAVVVRDLGIGFRPSEAARVFARFWRADPSRARTTGGTGLGLSIALEDARLHGGWLQAWGAPGQGAAFRLTLPRQAGGRFDSSPLPLEQEAVMTGA
jgi:two-component system sensor histidine kinase MtrB